MTTESKQKEFIANWSTWCHDIFQEEDSKGHSIKILMTFFLWEKKDTAKTITVNILSSMQIESPTIHQGISSKSTWIDTKVKFTLGKSLLSWKIAEWNSMVWHALGK